MGCVSLQADLKTVKEEATRAVGEAGQQWASSALAAATAASGAVQALTRAAAGLQAQLAAERQAHDGTRTEVIGCARRLERGAASASRLPPPSEFITAQAVVLQNRRGRGSTALVWWMVPFMCGGWGGVCVCVQAAGSLKAASLQHEASRAELTRTKSQLQVVREELTHAQTEQVRATAALDPVLSAAAALTGRC